MDPKKDSKEVLVIDPPTELRFVGPFSRPVVTIMTLTNPTNHLVLFKIKTTAPKRYCVRPNFGVVQPMDVTRVEICLQPFVYDANEKNKHKFMVQSLIGPDDCDDVSKVWKEAEPDRLMDYKLKCVFEMPTTNASSSGESPGASAMHGEASEAMKETKPRAMEQIMTMGGGHFNSENANHDDELRDDLLAIREECVSLRKENLALKEQVVRLRVQSTKPRMDEPYAPLAPANKPIPIFYLGIAFAAAIFFILVGKYIL